MCENFGIKSKGNTMFTNRQANIVFNYFYVKRKVLRDGVSTYLLDLVLKPAEITTSSGLEVIKFEFILRLKIKRNDWLLADTCPQAANHCALF